MTDPTLDTSPAPPSAGHQAQNNAALRRAIADSVRSTPGVISLEPTLHTAGLHGIYRRDDTDGILIKTISDHTAIEINIATDSAHPARRVAQATAQQITDLIQSADWTSLAPAITINVLRTGSA